MDIEMLSSSNILQLYGVRSFKISLNLNLVDENRSANKLLAIESHTICHSRSNVSWY